MDPCLMRYLSGSTNGTHRTRPIGLGEAGYSFTPRWFACATPTGAVWIRQARGAREGSRTGGKGARARECAKRTSGRGGQRRRPSADNSA
jgi:hypothetical protein